MKTERGVQTKKMAAVDMYDSASDQRWGWKEHLVNGDLSF